MALTGKTIGQLTYVDYTTNNFLIPVEEAGSTYHIGLSAITYTESTYSGLAIASAAGQLVRGQYYLMTDFQTIYDQPNWDQNGFAITTGNNKSGTTEQILLLATSTTGFSPTVFSTLYPSDKITYDINWTQTEVTNTPAKGRITERIDTVKNNRTDYDFRAVQFIRYVGFFSEVYRGGTVSLNGTTGEVTGVGTQFNSFFSVGDVIGIYYSNAPISCFRYYEIVSIIDDFTMTVFGLTMDTINNTYHASGIRLPNHSSPFKCNLTGGTYENSTEYYTFNNDVNFNTYIGDNQSYDTFILSNNVFKSGDYYNNTLGGNCVGNTFDDDMDSNTLGPYSSYNILTNDFDRNTCGPNFSYNIIDCDMRGNQISENFVYNMIGDDDGNDFDYNIIGWQFEGNFLTMSNNDFIGNIIGETFFSNIIDSGFRGNNIVRSFMSNKVIGSSFDSNFIGDYFNNNNIQTLFRGNQIQGNFYNNNIYSNFEGNIIGYGSYGNLFGESQSFGSYSFNKNTCGYGLNSNSFTGTATNNIIGGDCQLNVVGGQFSYNQIGAEFQNNTVGDNFGYDGVSPRGNVVGSGFRNNTVGPQFYDNTIGENCTANNFGEYFINNKISYNFNNVTTQDFDSSNPFRNNTFSYPGFNANLSLSGGTGGNPVFYTNIPTNVTLDYADANGYVTFLSGGTFIAQSLTV